MEGYFAITWFRVLLKVDGKSFRAIGHTSPQQQVLADVEAIGDVTGEGLGDFADLVSHASG